MQEYVELEVQGSQSEVQSFIYESLGKPQAIAPQEIDLTRQWDIVSPLGPISTVAQQQVLLYKKGLEDGAKQSVSTVPQSQPVANQGQGRKGSGKKKKKKRRKKFKPYTERIEELRKQERNLVEKLRKVSPLLAEGISREIPAPLSSQCQTGVHLPHILPSESSDSSDNSETRPPLTIGEEVIPFPTTRKEKVEALVKYLQQQNSADLLQQLVDQL